jgi:hypothetical protein
VLLVLVPAIEMSFIWIRRQGRHVDCLCSVTPVSARSTRCVSVTGALPQVPWVLRRWTISRRDRVGAAGDSGLRRRGDDVRYA